MTKGVLSGRAALGLALGVAASCATSEPESVGRLSQGVEELSWSAKPIPAPDPGLTRVSAYQAAVAWNGTHYVQIFTDTAGRAWASRLSQTLEAVDVPPLLLGENYSYETPPPAVACGSNGECLLVWLGGGVHARRLTALGQLGPPLLLGSSDSWTRPSVTAVPGGFVAVWAEVESATTVRAEAAFVDDAGSFTKKTLLANDGAAPQIAWNGSALLVVSGTTTTAQLVASRFDVDLTAIDPMPVPLAQAKHDFRLVSHGTGFALAQHHGLEGQLDFRLIGSDLSLGAIESFAITETTDLHLARADGGHVSIYQDTAGRLFRRFRSDSGVWSSGTLNVRSSRPAAMAFSPTQGVVVMPNGYLEARALKGNGAPNGSVVTAAYALATPRWTHLAARPGGYAAGYEQPTESVPSQARVVRVSSDGTVLDDPPLLPHQGAALYNRGLAYGDEALLAAVEAEDGYFTMIATSGGVSEQQDAFRTHDIAASSQGFLSVGFVTQWTSQYAWTQRSFLQRRSATGELLDASPIEICTDYGYGEEGTACGRPRVTSSGDTYVVDWSNQETYPDFQHEFLIVHADGSSNRLPALPDQGASDWERNRHQVLAAKDGQFTVWRNTDPPVVAQLSPTGEWGEWQTVTLAERYGQTLRLFGQQTVLLYRRGNDSRIAPFVGVAPLAESRFDDGGSFDVYAEPLVESAGIDTPAGLPAFVALHLPEGLRHYSPTLTSGAGGEAGGSTVVGEGGAGAGGAGGQGVVLPGDAGAGGQGVVTPPSDGGATSGSAGQENEGGNPTSEAGRGPRDPGEAGQGNTTPSTGGVPGSHGGEPSMSSAGAGDAAPDDEGEADCQCRAVGSHGSNSWALLLLVAAGLRGRRRKPR